MKSQVESLEVEDGPFEPTQKIGNASIDEMEVQGEDDPMDVDGAPMDETQVVNNNISDEFRSLSSGSNKGDGASQEK